MSRLHPSPSRASLAPDSDPPANLRANLEALARQSPHAAGAISGSAAAPLEWAQSAQQGAPSAALDQRALASRKRPLEEAQRLVDRVNLDSAGVVCILGFALGYHVRALASKCERHTLIVVYEPDVALLRAVFERKDHSEWLSAHNVVILTDETDRPGALAALRGAEALFALGVEFLEHPPSTSRLGQRAGEFASMLTSVVESFRTTVITTMVHTEVTIRNELMNAEAYAQNPGIDDLGGAAKGRPAIVVSAGPSLRRNIALLENPEIRDRAVIICVQTVLKTLLERGITPHFVTALDYHEISRRFYEGLSARDVEGVTLVAEPKANSAIIDAWPGALRFVNSEMLDRAMGKRLAGARASLEPGATVAHLAYYLARHLQSDPVILVGQDLAFSDGQYYAPGAAIHDVWAPELNPFNTLETMEWQRIVRMRGHLQKGEDHLGQPVYTDDQMSTYLAQFERDFKRDAESGLAIIDATEGGIRKAHTEVMPLREALAAHLEEGNLPWTPPSAPPVEGSTLSRTLRKRLEHVRDDVHRIEQYSREASSLLGEMERAESQPARINQLVAEVHALRERVERLEVAYWLVHRLNQTGGLKRFKADRELKLQALDLDERETHARRVQRDRANVEWLADAAVALRELLDVATQALPPSRKPKLTRDRPLEAPDALGAGATDVSVATTTRTGALIVLDPKVDPFGRPKPAEIDSSLRCVTERLARVSSLNRIVLATDDPGALDGLGADAAGIEILPIDLGRWRARHASMRGARSWARSCWRGGLGGATIWDEAFDPLTALEAMESANLDAALIVGADWPLVDPDLSDQVIRRHLENPRSHPIAFCQAPPGLSGCVISRDLVAKLAEGRHSGDPLASIGGVLGFRPTRPISDPIGTSACVQIDPEIRGALHRFTLDDALVRTWMGDDSSGEWSAREVVDRWRGVALRPPLAPLELIVEATTRRTRPRIAADRPDLSVDSLQRLVAGLVEQQSFLSVTLAGFGDPMRHPGIIDLIDAAHGAGALSVHVRTELVCDLSFVDRLASSSVDVVSLDLHANTAATYASLTESDLCARALENSERLLALRKGKHGWLSPWVVPRILRRDEVLDEIEGFYDKSIYFASCGVIDQQPRRIENARIEPLGKPRAVRTRDALARMMVLSDGAVIADERDDHGASPIGNAFDDDPIEVWRRLMERRTAALESGRSASDDSLDPLWTGW